MKTLIVLLRKEFKQFFGNKFLPKMAFMFPLMIMLIMPLVTTMDVKHVGIALVDNDHSTLSRNIAENFTASTYTDLVTVAPNYQVALKCIEDGSADVIVELPTGLQTSLKTRHPEKISVAANAVNSTKGSMGTRYVQQIIMETLTGNGGYLPNMRNAQLSAANTLSVSSLNMFNPTLNYKYFMIPALTIMLLVMICGFLPALNVVSEKEIGTIEQINVSPISQLTFTMGKVIPYWIIGYVVLTIAMIVGWLVYGLTVVGNIGLIYLASTLFVIVMSSMAVIIANFSDNMQQVMMMMFFFIVIFILMSGLLTPIQSMPEWAQYLTYGLPPRYYIDVLRSVYLRGSTFMDLMPSFLALTGYAIVFSAIAVLTYKKQN